MWQVILSVDLCVYLIVVTLMMLYSLFIVRVVFLFMFLINIIEQAALFYSFFLDSLDKLHSTHRNFTMLLVCLTLFLILNFLLTLGSDEPIHVAVVGAGLGSASFIHYLYQSLESSTKATRLHIDVFEQDVRVKNI